MKFYIRNTCRSIPFLFLTTLAILILIYRTFTDRYFINISIEINSTILDISRSHPCGQINRTSIDIGREHFSHSRVIICGLIRDREKHLPRFQRQIYEITRLFASYAIVIVENDSRDRTREELIRWSKEDRHVHLVECSQSNQSSCRLALAATRKERIPSLSRIEKMVRLRNLYMDYIDEQSIFHRYDYVIIEDYDLTTLTYIDGLFSTAFHFDRDPTIDAICANGIFYQPWIPYEMYFDPYAHIDEQNEHWTYEKNLRWSRFFRHYPCREELQWAKSCFSGRTIYRYASIRDKRYRTYLNEHHEPICEHVGLHQTLKNIYLNGRMLFYIVKNNLVY